MTQATIGQLDSPSSPMPQAGAAVELIASGALSQDFNDRISAVVSVKDARRVALWTKYTPHASATAGYPHIVVALSAKRDAPALGDDSWYLASQLDASASDADLSGNTLPTGADWTQAPEFRELKAGPIVLRTFAASGSASEVVRVKFAIDVTDARWMYVAAVEKGDTTNDGTIAIDWSISL